MVRERVVRGADLLLRRLRRLVVSLPLRPLVWCVVVYVVCPANGGGVGGVAVVTAALARLNFRITSPFPIYTGEPSYYSDLHLS